MTGGPLDKIVGGGCIWVEEFEKQILWQQYWYWNRPCRARGRRKGRPKPGRRRPPQAVRRPRRGAQELVFEPDPGCQVGPAPSNSPGAESDPQTRRLRRRTRRPGPAPHRRPSGRSGRPLAICRPSQCSAHGRCRSLQCPLLRTLRLAPRSLIAFVIGEWRLEAQVGTWGRRDAGGAVPSRRRRADPHVN